jgi:hypothetical protein
VDLKPYEEFGCDGLPLLSDLVRAEIRRADEDDGVSPFVRESFEPILTAAASRLDPEGTYAPDSQAPTAVTGDRTGLVVSDKWVIFARPRSQHIVLQDIDRLRRATREATEPVEGVASRLVTHPSSQIDGGRAWAPIGSVLGADLPDLTTEEDAPYTDVFFPKPFNDDQIEIVKRLARSDGLVVQGPPGTGKTHTIANLICHAMATGQRVLVVSRGEAALAVLREQLPEEVRPLAISILSSERQGLRQVEGAIRQVQEVVEATQPESRVKGIRRRETEILDLRRRNEAIDGELDDIAVAHLAKFGPRKETPAELAVPCSRPNEIWSIAGPLGRDVAGAL